MANDNFKKSPIHDKKAIIDMMDELHPQEMIELVEFLKSKTTRPKQSSIELLELKLTKLDLGYKSGNISYTDYLQGRNKAIEQSKEIHKEEILGSWGNGWANGDVDVNRYEDAAEKFYNEEFGGNK